MKYYHIYPFLLFAFLFIACNRDNEKTIESDPITFISQAGSFAGSSEDGRWQSGDQIGAYILDNNTFTNVNNASSNIIYTAGSTGASATFSSKTPFKYPADKLKVDFIAYYPYSSVVSNFVYPINLSNQADGTSKHDLMRATSEGQSILSSTEVPMTFSHQLSKVAFKFVDDNNANIYPAKLTINGMNTIANYNISTGTLQNVSSITKIIAYKPETGHYEAILLPTTISTDTHIVSYTIDDKIFEWNMSQVAGSITSIQAGYKYTFIINQDDLKAPAKVEIESGSVTPWNNHNYEDGGNASLITDYTLYPANETKSTFKDTYLKLTFKDKAPAIGNTGTIRVYKASDNTLVDEINMADEQPRFINGGTLNSKMDIIGKVGNNGNRHRVVNYNPITIEGNSAIIKLHYDCLNYNTKYYVQIDKGAISHVDFKGISGNSKWTFTTKAEPTTPTDANNTITVGYDNNADFRTIQAAMDFLSSKVNNNNQKTVYVHNGIYEELLFIRGVNNMTIKGESREGVIIRYTNNDGINGGTGGSGSITDRSMGAKINSGGGRAVMLIERVDKFRIENLTLESEHADNKGNGQAEAIYANNDTNQGIIFRNCNILSFQDTLNLKGFSWFYNCLIAGDVDFIWGSPIAALFEGCEIRSRGNGYVLQARVSENNKGFVFLNCDLTTTGTVTQAFLARTTSNASYFDNITFANCRMDDIYGVNGWGLSGGATGNPPTPAIGTLANGYKMYNCTKLDDSAIMINNSNLAYTLTENEFANGFSTPAIVLAGYSDINWFQ